jgi:hypothetical protein
VTAARRRLQLPVEDVGLAAWNALGVPVAAASGAAAVVRLGDEPDMVAGTLQLLAVLGAIVAVATRPAGVAAEPGPATFALRVGFIGPFMGAVAMVSGSVSGYLGLGVDGLLVAAGFVAVVAALALGDRLPVLPAWVRRGLLVPFLLVCAGIFDGLAADLLQELDVGELIGALRVDATGFGLFVVGLLLAGIAAFYAALIVSPRVLVERQSPAGWLVWPVRFVLFLASALLGIGWLTLL